MSFPSLTRARVVALLLAAACAHAAPAGPVSPQVMRTEQVSGTGVLLIAISPVSEQVAWASGDRGTYLRTVDGGATWQAGKVPGADSLQFRDVQAVDANTAFLLSIPGDGSRIYKTTNAGRDWTLQFHNPDPRAFYDCMSFWDERRGIVIGDAIDDKMAVLRTDDGGMHWVPVPPASLPAALPGEGSFAASGTCITTRPGGLAWAVMNNRDHSRLLHTRDFGKTWSLDTLPVTTRDGVGAQSIAMRDDRNGMALGGGYGSRPDDVGSAVTHDGGETWSPSGRPHLTNGVWGGVFVPGARVPTVVAVGPQGATYSRDEGRTWVALDSANYWSVGFASPRAGWAVGQGGRITRFSGF